MVSIAVTGPLGSHAWQAAHLYAPDGDIRIFPNLTEVFNTLTEGQTDLAMVPIYNTNVGQIREAARLIRGLDGVFWRDNLVVPIQLSLGALPSNDALTGLVAGTSLLQQCAGLINTAFPNIPITAVADLEAAVFDIKEKQLTGQGVIESEESLLAWGLSVRLRDILPHNRTRFAVFGKTPALPSGYDATALITNPIKDRVGMLVDILSEFTKRGINLLDMQTETDPQSQKLQFFIELEGHLSDERVRAALERIEHHIIEENGSVRVLGSYPRVDMRGKRIKRFGFIGSGDMSEWFAERLRSEGYETIITGRSSAIRPEAMISQVEAVAICVPISVTPAAIEQYGPMLGDGQALILLAGAAENVLDTAMNHTRHGVEILLVHNLWGPKAATMKDKNASVVRTPRSGVLSNEFEAFLYKHGARISFDTPAQHDLMMGVGQKLPTSIAVAFAMALKDNAIPTEAIGSHATLTSLYSILAMARVHAQNPRTYAEIMASSGLGSRLVRDFSKNLATVLDLAENAEINALLKLIEDNRSYLGEAFLQNRMNQALAVDQTLGRVLERD